MILVARRIFIAMLGFALLCIAFGATNATIDMGTMIMLSEGKQRVETQAVAQCPPGRVCPVSPPVKLTPALEVPTPTSGVVQPWESAVRIRVSIGRGFGIGSGTIIAGDAERSVVLTCAHLFRLNEVYQSPSEWTLPITVDLFDGKLSKSGAVAYTESFGARVIDFDGERDVAVIEFAPGRVLKASRIVAEDWQPRPRIRFVSVGCTKGANATAWYTAGLSYHHGALNSYSAYICDRPSIEGRSGGGLFVAETGRLAGVCNAVDRARGEGYYATAESVRFILRRAHLTQLITEAGDHDDTGILNKSKQRQEEQSQAPPAAQPHTPFAAPPATTGRSLLERVDGGHLTLGGLALAAVGVAARSRFGSSAATGIAKAFANGADSENGSPATIAHSPVAQVHHAPLGDAAMANAVATIMAVLKHQQAVEQASADAADEAAKAKAVAEAIKAAARPTGPANAGAAPFRPTDPSHA